MSVQSLKWHLTEFCVFVLRQVLLPVPSVLVSFKGLKDQQLKHSLPCLLGPPYIVSPPENITVNISQNALFTCQAEAYPGNLTYTWFWEEDNVYFKK